MDAAEARRLLGANIRALAAQRQMSLNRLADFAAVNRPHLLRVVSGKADATVGWLTSVATALDVELHVLVMPLAEEADLRKSRATLKKKPAGRRGRQRLGGPRVPER